MARGAAVRNITLPNINAARLAHVPGWDTNTPRAGDKLQASRRFIAQRAILLLLAEAFLSFCGVYLNTTLVHTWLCACRACTGVVCKLCVSCCVPPRFLFY